MKGKLVTIEMLDFSKLQFLDKLQIDPRVVILDHLDDILIDESEEDEEREFDDPQLSLALAERFAPSKALTDFWIKSIEALAREAAVRPIKLMIASSEMEIPHQFSMMLTSLFGAIAQKLRGEGVAD